MAYFPNGTSGQVLDDQCDECIHGLSNDVMCPVYFVQIQFNYIQVGPRQAQLRKAMNFLVDAEGKCQMKAAFEKVRYVKTVDDDISELERFDRERGKVLWI